MLNARWAASTIALIATLVSAGCARPTSTTANFPSAADARPAAPPSGAIIREAYGRMPLQFEENRGQADPSVKYLSRGQGYALLLTSQDVVLHFGVESLRIAMVGGRPDRTPTGINGLPGKTNYLIGPDATRWRTGITTYGKVRYADVYPGIDAVFYGNQRQLEYDFVVAPGADPKRIRLAISGGSSVTIGDGGDLLFDMKSGTVVQRKPTIYQDIDGTRVPVDGGYLMRGPREVGFRVGRYDRTRPLVIDPVVSYATYLGGTDTDVSRDIVVDGSGNAYIVGHTLSTDFPVVGGVQSTKRGDALRSDAFIMKLNPAGTAPVYSTYLGGGESDAASLVAVDGAGNVVVAGGTGSSDFPTTTGVPSTPGSLFVAKLNASGSALLYSTLLRTGSAVVTGLALDASGNAYVAGYTGSELATTPGAFQPAPPGPDPGPGFGFLTKLTATGDVAWSTYLTGSGGSNVHGIAVDSSGVYVIGAAFSADFPTTQGAFQTTDPTVDRGGAVFVTKLDPTGSSLVYSTFLGGSGSEWPGGIAVSNGFAHVTGLTFSTDFPIVNGFQTTNANASAGEDPPSDAFVAKLNQTGTGLVFSTYVGGTGEDIGDDIAIDSSGNIYVAGFTSSADFPAKEAIAAFTPSGRASGQHFVAKFDGSGALVYSTPAGTREYAGFSEIAVDASGSAYLTGSGAPLRTTPNAFQPTPPGGLDGFVVKLAPGTSGGTGDTTPPTVAITKPSNGAWTGNSIGFGVTASDNVGLVSVKLWGNGGVFATLTCNGTPTCSSSTLGWLTGPLPPAAYQVQAVALDTAGNQTVSAPITIFKDATSPVVASGASGGGGGTTPPPLAAAITSPANGATVSGSAVPVSMAASNAQGSPISFVLKVDNGATILNQSGSASNATVSWSTTGLANGPHTLNLTVTDGAGRTATAVTSVTVSNTTGGGTGDTTPPTVAITKPSNGAWTGNSIGFSVSASDNVGLVSIKMWGNGGVFATVTCNGTPTCSSTTVGWVTGSLPPAAYQVQAVALDTAGNQTVSAPITIFKDATSPTVASGASAGGGGTTPPALGAAISSPANGTTVSGSSVGVTMSASNAQGTSTSFVLKVDNTATIFSQSVSGSTATTTWNTTGLTNGSHTLNLTVTDGAGRTASAAVSVTVSNTTGGGGGGDTTAPSVAITKPSNNAWTGNSIDVTASASDNVGLASLTFFGNGTQFAQVSCGGTATCTKTEWWLTGPLPSGKHTLTVVATDSAGNKTTSAPVTINK